MKPRLVALIALSFVLYVVTSVGAAGQVLGFGALSLSLVAVASAVAPLWLPAPASILPPLARVSSLAIVVAVVLAAKLALRANAQLGALFGAFALPALGLTVVRLASFVPDRPPALVRERFIAPLAIALCALGTLLGVCAEVAPKLAPGRTWGAEGVAAVAPIAAAIACLAGAATLRLLRRQLGSSVQAQAENLWASLGLVAAGAAIGGAYVLHTWANADDLGDALTALAGAALLLGHALAVLPNRARLASARARALCLVLIASAMAGAAIVPVAIYSAQPLPLACGLFALVFLAVQALAGPLVFRLLAPAGGALLEAIAEIRRDALIAADADELASRVLKPLRRAAGLPEAAPILFSFDPPRTVQLDAAGFARALDRAPPAALASRLRSHPGDSLVTDELLPRLRRRPELDAVVNVLRSHDALCVVPLHAGGELVAALLVARGARRATLTLEELHALTQLGDEIAQALSCFAALDRARHRADDSERARDALALKLDEQALVVDLLEQQHAAVKASLGLPLPDRDPIGYSPAMRTLAEQLGRIAPQALPVLLWGETGLALAPVAQSLHRLSGRGTHPFVIVDCATLPPERAFSRLFGRGTPHGEQPGLLSLLGEGTLLLLDLPALPRVIQVALADMLAERRGQPVDSLDSFPFHGRIVATARRPLGPLVAVGAIAPELARWFEDGTHRVPPLRERPEDLESLLLLALDRAARVLGTAAKGVEASALELLLDHPWHGNDAELVSVIEQAVAHAEGPRITRDDLPPLGGDALGLPGSSYAEQERGILRRALRQAGGSHTAAARALKIRRAALIEKLHQLELEDKSNAEN